MRLTKQDNQFIILAAAKDEVEQLEALVGSIVEVTEDQSPVDTVDPIHDCKEGHMQLAGLSL